MTYVEISKKKVGTGCVLLSNGDLIHEGGASTVQQGIWFFVDKQSGYAKRLEAKSKEEALEEYQNMTGNCIVI